MKVRIGNIWFDSEDMPMMVVFSKKERKFLKSTTIRVVTNPRKTNKLCDSEFIRFCNGDYVKMEGGNEII